MMGRDPFETMTNLIVLLILVAVVLVLALALTPIFLVGVPVLAGVHLFRRSDFIAERRARRETMQLYSHAKKGRSQLSDEDIDRVLSSKWPADVPETLRIQLLEIGRAIFTEEGLDHAVPPPPAVHNSVEAARYRDMIARLGQARGDANMPKTALEVISDALEPIAAAAPPIDGNVLVEVTQFTQPLGAAVQSVMAPFFQDNDYVHFKRLRERLEVNINATHRSNPV